MLLDDEIVEVRWSPPPISVSKPPPPQPPALKNDPFAPPLRPYVRYIASIDIGTKHLAVVKWDMEEGRAVDVGFFSPGKLR